jgi:orotate phosphoribosyltransferase
VFAIRTLPALTLSKRAGRRVSVEPSWHERNVWHAILTHDRRHVGTVTYHEDMTTLTERETLDLYEKTGALMRGHFRLTSGLHSDIYLQSALVLQHPEHAARLGEALAAPFAGARAQTVLAPAIGGILVAHEVARALGARALFTEREEGVMRLRRGFALTAGERCLVVEDVITTGGSTREVMDCVRAAGGDVIGVGSLIDRSGGTAAFAVTRAALATVNATTWPPESCPLCKTGSRAVKPGSRS